MKIAINGLGRIGRHVLLHVLDRRGLSVVAVNDLVSADNLAYLLKFDSTHGRSSKEIKVEDDHLVVNGQKILVLTEKDPAKLPWKELGVDYIVESTGRFTRKEDASKHLEAGAKRVIISAPAKGDGIPTFVMGVNHQKYNPASDAIVSNASCTTNCLAPLTKVILDNFGFEEGLMTTVHAVTAAQAVVDGPSKKNLRLGRGAYQNIIPASTGAAKVVGLCIPEVEGKLTGMAFRVPVANVSVVDLTVRVSKSTTYEAICESIRSASRGEMKGILEYCNEFVVSSDFNGCEASSIFDAKAGIALSDRFFKLIAWYDNEISYAVRVVDLMHYMSEQE